MFIHISGATGWRGRTPVDPGDPEAISAGAAIPPVAARGDVYNDQVFNPCARLATCLRFLSLLCVFLCVSATRKATRAGRHAQHAGRQRLCATRREPRPNYWPALLWRKLMGTAVLDLTIPIRHGLHVYAHGLRGKPSGVALLVINTDRSARRFSAPADDELLGAGVQVALAEWRGVHRVEKLLQLRDVNFDLHAARRNRPTSGSLILAHARLLPCRRLSTPWKTAHHGDTEYTEKTRMENGR